MVFGQAALGLSNHPRSPRDERVEGGWLPTPPSSRATPDHAQHRSTATRPSVAMERRHSFPETLHRSRSDPVVGQVSLPPPEAALPMQMDKMYPSKSSGDPRISPLDSRGGTKPVAPALPRRQSESFLEYNLPKTPTYSFIPLPTVTAANTPVGTPAASPERDSSSVSARLLSARRLSSSSNAERQPKRWAPGSSTPSYLSTPQQQQQQQQQQPPPPPPPPPPLLTQTRTPHATSSTTAEERAHAPWPTHRPPPPQPYMPSFEPRVVATRDARTADLLSHGAAETSSSRLPAGFLPDAPVAPLGTADDQEVTTLQTTSRQQSSQSHRRQ